MENFFRENDNIPSQKLIDLPEVTPFQSKELLQTVKSQLETKDQLLLWWKREYNKMKIENAELKLKNAMQSEVIGELQVALKKEEEVHRITESALVNEKEQHKKSIAQFEEYMKAVSEESHFHKVGNKLGSFLREQLEKQECPFETDKIEELKQQLRQEVKIEWERQHWNWQHIYHGPLVPRRNQQGAEGENQDPEYQFL